MPQYKTITIVGGGLAGLTLGIALRLRNVPVELFEAGHYPRHRVCGEFIHGRGRKVLEGLGLTRLLIAGGALPVRTARFFCGQVRSPERTLPENALCISRHQFDSLMAKEFKRLGGSLFDGRRFAGNFTSEGLARATGRRLHPTDHEPRWFGLKAHAVGLALQTGLEMHLLPNGYVGLCRSPEGKTNVCGIFRKDPENIGTAAAWQEVLRGPADSSLRQHLEKAEFLEETFCAVAGIDLRPELPDTSGELRIGDTLTMIPPVTGNGMSIAMESAAIAAGPLHSYAAGQCTWAQAKARIARDSRAAFSRRLKWASRLQTLIMQAHQHPAATRFALDSPLAWRLFYTLTR